MIIHEAHYTLKADLITPVSLYRKLRCSNVESFLMESTDVLAAKNGKSFVGYQPIAGFKIHNNLCSLNYGSFTKNIILNSTNNILSFYKQFYNGLQFATKPQQINGLFGYCNFDIIPYIEKISHTNTQPNFKDIAVCNYQLYKYLFVFDHFKNTMDVIVNLQQGETLDEAKKVIATFAQTQISDAVYFEAATETESNLTDEAYMAMVQQGINHCKRGDVFQVVLSRRYSQKFSGDDFEVYRELRCINPSPYLFYFDYLHYKIFGSSPESILVKNGTQAFIHPIAGTVKRTGNNAADKALADALKIDPKERSEHIMLVDLARNDLSKHGKQVTVTSFIEPHYYSHLIHLVSEVTATITSNNNALGLLTSVYPAGTLSGAPKHKALQIINTLENEKRSYYGGSIGIINFEGDINQAIIIRSFLSKNNILTTQAGAGVVVSSTPQGECNEVKTKLAAMVKAVEIATANCKNNNP